MTIPPMTALGGALVRHADGGWTWCDGEPEPRVSDLRIADYRVSEFAPAGLPTRGGES